MYVQLFCTVEKVCPACGSSRTQERTLMLRGTTASKLDPALRQQEQERTTTSDARGIRSRLLFCIQQHVQSMEISEQAMVPYTRLGSP